jgi:hypothetical protein
MVMIEEKLASILVKKIHIVACIDVSVGPKHSLDCKGVGNTCCMMQNSSPILHKRYERHAGKTLHDIPE